MRLDRRTGVLLIAAGASWLLSVPPGWAKRSPKVLGKGMSRDRAEMKKRYPKLFAKFGSRPSR